MLSLLHQPPSRLPADRDPILVLADRGRALDLIRVAVLRSDMVTAVVADPNEQLRHFAERFAVELIARAPAEADLADAKTALIALADAAAENRLVRAARQSGVPIHVAGRALVSDFTLLELLELHPSSLRAA